MSKPRTSQVEPFLPPRRELESPLCRVVLVEPLIPENTGNISRTCVGTNTELHLVEPLGFELTESRVKRAGLDYWNNLALRIHGSFDKWVEFAKAEGSENRVFFVETWGEKSLHQAEFQRGDWLVFGKETTGLTREQVESLAGGVDRVLHLPMPGEVRSLNLSNAVAVSVFEVLRQVEKPL
ncbi:tRNA (cytidine(34)-2'-O)-methyltransferase [soil metagenome]